MNCHTCLSGSSATTMFELPPPLLEEYIPLTTDFLEVATHALPNPAFATFSRADFANRLNAAIE